MEQAGHLKPLLLLEISETFLVPMLKANQLEAVLKTPRLPRCTGRESNNPGQCVCPATLTTDKSVKTGLLQKKKTIDPKTLQ